jgi:hypothetical protein
VQPTFAMNVSICPSMGLWPTSSMAGIFGKAAAPSIIHRIRLDALRSDGKKGHR